MKMTKGSIGTMNQTAKRKSFRFGIILPLGLTQLLTMYLLLIVVPRPERSLFSSVSTNIGQQDQYMGSFSTNSMENDIEMDHQYLRRRIEQEPQVSTVPLFYLSFFALLSCGKTVVVCFRFLV